MNGKVFSFSTMLPGTVLSADAPVYASPRARGS